MAVDVEALAEAIDAALRSGGSSEQAEKDKAYLKSDPRHYDTSVPAIRGVAKAISRQHPELVHDHLAGLVDTLWSQPVHERRMASVELLDVFCDQLGPSDAVLLERLLRESRTWALADGLAASVVGALVERHPDLGAVLDRWSTDSELWLRRSASSPCSSPSGRAAATSSASAAMPTPCSRSGTSSSARPSAGCCATPAASAPTSCMSGSARAARASEVTIREAVKPLTAVQRAAILAAR